MMIKSMLLSLLSFLPLTLCDSDSVGVETVETAPSQPNIVFLLADDLGWNDVGFHESSDIRTPNIDELFSSGLSLNYHYVMPQCTPSRAAFLTGRYPIRYGLHHDSISPSDQYGLPLTETLLPQELSNGGYETFMVGKWHLGYFAWEYTPTFRGFDKFYGFYNGAVDYDTHSRSWDNVQGYDLRDGIEPVYNDDYATYYQRDKSIEYIEKRDKTKPFFLYTSFQAVHSPNQIPTGDVWKSYKSLTSRARKIHATKATIMDDAIGDIINKLKDEGIWDNTIIIFTSDNGAIYNAGSNYPLRGSKSTIWEGGIRVPSIVNGGYLKDEMRGNSVDGLFHVVDWLPTFLEIAGIERSNNINELDGISQLSLINGELEEDVTSLREGFLVHTDPLDCQHTCGAYRWGKWKLIRDPRRTLKNEKTKEGCFWTDDFKKDGSTATINCQLNERIDTTDLSCGCGTETCLFNIEEDPCEEVDLSEEYPVVLQKIYKMLSAYNKTDNNTGHNQIATPLSELFPPDTDGADPNLHNGFWTPWMTAERLPRDSDDPSDLMGISNVIELVSIDDSDIVSDNSNNDGVVYVSDDAVESSNETNKTKATDKENSHAILRWTLIVIVGLIFALSANMIRTNCCQENNKSTLTSEIAPLLTSDHYRRAQLSS